MRHNRPAAIVAVVLVALLAAGTSISAAEPARPANDAKVVVIVGPVGSSTARFKRTGEAAAREAEKYTSNVVRLFTPDATWPAVKAALQGASVVVYAGHGNGWPSKYRDHLYPPTQNGFGLNPVKGGGNSAHQYFGEKYIAENIKLAPNATVILSHLCYASGNTEPGLPEGTIDQARQRIDNFAAGFIAAGAGAVIAEGHDGADGYIREIFRSRSTIESIWRAAPTFHDNVSTFESERSEGYVAAMDPDRPSSGFYRSLVTKPGLKTAHVLGGATGEAAFEAPAEGLMSAGFGVTSSRVVGYPSAGEIVDVKIRYSGVKQSVVEGIQIGLRWDPIDVPAPATSAEESGEPPPLSTEPERLVVAETPGTVVAPETARHGTEVFALKTEAPAAPGLYRLVITLHDAEGVAYDLATQALVPALLVRVTGEADVGFRVQPSAVVDAGEALDMPFVVTNFGTAAWGNDGRGREEGPWERASAVRGMVVGQWVGLIGSVAKSADATFEEPAGDDYRMPAKNDAMAVGSVVLPAILRPGEGAEAVLKITAPEKAGQYLLLLDVVVPGKGSMAARGAEPALVRVDVR